MRWFLAFLLALLPVAARATTVMFTTPGVNTWVVPVDWTAANEIDCEGSGGNGADPLGGAQSGAGAGGGQWAQALNVVLTPGDTIELLVAGGNSPFGVPDGASFACNLAASCHYNSPQLFVYAVNGDWGTLTGTHQTSSPGLGGGNFTGTTAPATPSNCPTDGLITCGLGNVIINGSPGGTGGLFPSPWCPTVTAPGGAIGGEGAGPLGGGGGLGGTPIVSGGTCLAGTGLNGNNYGGGAGGNSASNPGQGGPPSGFGAQGYCRVIYPFVAPNQTPPIFWN